LNPILFRDENVNCQQPIIMGFADLSIAEIAVDYNVPVEDVLRLCDELGIAYKHPRTRLALEDVKAIISKLDRGRDSEPIAD
jgi:hypothetical protein